MGAMVALEAAAHFASSIDQLILVGGFASFCDRLDHGEHYELGVSTTQVEAMMEDLKNNRQRTMERFLLRTYRKSIVKSEIANKTKNSLELDQNLLLHGLDYLRCADVRTFLNQIEQTNADPARRTRSCDYPSRSNLSKPAFT